MALMRPRGNERKREVGNAKRVYLVISRVRCTHLSDAERHFSPSQRDVGNEKNLTGFKNLSSLVFGYDLILIPYAVLAY